MKRWEYKWIAPPADWYLPHRNSGEFAQEVQEAGDQGWELVSITAAGVYVFKRPILLMIKDGAL